MQRYLKALIPALVVLGVYLTAGWMLSKRHRVSSADVLVTQPATPGPTSPASPDTSAEDSCNQSVVLTVQPHAGVSTLWSVQNLEGQDIPTRSVAADEGAFTTTCDRQENDAIGAASPQVVKVCKPRSFVLHITGRGKGLFDLQARAFPDVAHPVSPLLLCNYTLDNDRVYDWVLKYQSGSRPAVFLLGSKGDPSVKP